MWGEKNEEMRKQARKIKAENKKLIFAGNQDIKQLFSYLAIQLH